MIERLAEKAILLKRELARTRGGAGLMMEIVPDLGIPGIDKMTGFAEKNPIYHRSYREKILGTDCTIYRGDINDYWLGSIMHESSRAPFSPTWIVSAFLLVLELKDMGYESIVDVGSGDGRIAFLAKSMGVGAYSIEIDEDLVDLQKKIMRDAGVDFSTICADATECDFASMDLQNPVFCIGGLAPMGGASLASAIIDNIAGGRLESESGFVFTGSISPKYAGSEFDGGWGGLIRDAGLHKTKTITLPTAWTFEMPDETPYIFARFQASASPRTACG